MNKKKIHAGIHGKPLCITRISAHVRRGPVTVARIEWFVGLRNEAKCQRCEKLVDAMKEKTP